MAISKKLKKFLDQQHMEYSVLHHREAFTSQEIAGAQHEPGKQVLKCVVINVDGQLIMCVMSAVQMLDFNKLKKETRAKDVALVSENELSELFPEYEIGAEPPIAELCGLPMWMDANLKNNKEIVFNAGTHTDMIKMSLSDYWQLSQPDKVGNFCKHI